MNKKDIIEAFEFRHACKVFDVNKKIPADDFACILESARLSPSSFGFEPWNFLVVQNQELREKFLKVFWGGQGQFPTASHLVFALVKNAPLMRYDSEYIKHMMVDVQKLPEDIVKLKSQFYKNFQESDFDLLSSNRALNDWATHQTYIALANMMSVAAMLKIDSCPMEGFDKKQTNKLLENELGIDLKKHSLVYAVAFGYRLNQPHPKTRQNIDDIVQWFF